jgi:uncharacterized YccA/Bax inhibitor family protein
MDQKADFDSLRFDRTVTRPVNRRLVIVIASVVAFALLWAIIPSATMFWLLGLIIGGLVWVASFGYRPALARLIKFLQKLEQQ